MDNRLVSSFAIICTLREANRTDYIDLFLPFVCEALRKTQSHAIALEDLQTVLRAQTGLEIPQAALRTILRRAARQGYVTKENHIYVKNPVKLKNASLAPQRHDANHTLDNLSESFRDYTERQHGRSLSPDRAATTILGYLERHSLSLLRAGGDRNELRLAKSSSQDDYFAASFILHSFDTETKDVSRLEQIAKGSMLADTLTLPNPSEAVGAFQKLRVFLDTRIVLRALGYAGAIRETPAKELLRLLRSHGASVHVFEHTITEIDAILGATSNAITMGSRYEPGRYEVSDWAITQRLHAPEIEVFRAKLNDSLLACGIAPTDPPDFDPSLSINETALQNLVETHVTYSNPDAVVPDVKSITAIHQMRQGRPFRRLEDSKAVFVTTNHGLSKASAAFFKESLVGGEFVPHAFPDDLFTSLAWLKDPDAAATMPRARLVAECLAAINPGEEVWVQVLNHAERLLSENKINESDFAILRYTTTAQRALMEATQGNPEVFTEGTIYEVIEHAKEQFAKEAREQADRDRLLRAKAEREAQQLRAGNDRLADRLATGVAVAVEAILVIVVVIGVFVPWPAGGVVAKSIVGAVASVWYTLGLLNIWTGVSIRRIRRSLQERIRPIAAHLVSVLSKDDTK
ncbi:MAG: hypothetical protein WD294_03985 [Phycisphaeraceae bacterium]